MTGKRILAFILAVAMVFGDSTLASAAAVPGENVQTEEGTNTENELEKASDTIENETESVPESGESCQIFSDSADEARPDSAAEDKEEFPEIEPVYGESAVLKSYLDGSSSDDYGISQLEEREWNGSFGTQIAENVVAKELYDYMVQCYVDGTDTGDIYPALKNPITFPASIITSNGTNAIERDEEFENAVRRLTDGFYMAFPAFIRDYPEVFWIAGMQISYKITASGNADAGYVGNISDITLGVTKYYDGEEPGTEEYQEAVNNVKFALEQELGTDASRYEIVKKIHDYLCETLEYNHDAVNGGDTDDYLYAHTSSTAFLGREPDGVRSVVCEGYAKAMKVLCDRWEIPCVLVSGRGITQNSSEAHMWNYVQMEDGKWYAVDVTWDDQDPGIQYHYFLVGQESQGFYQPFGTDHQPLALTADTETLDEIFRFMYPALENLAYEPEKLQDEGITGILLTDESGSPLEELSFCVGETKKFRLLLQRADGMTLPLEEGQVEIIQAGTKAPDDPNAVDYAEGWYDKGTDSDSIFVEGIRITEETVRLSIIAEGFDALTEEAYTVSMEIPVTVSAGTEDYPDYREADIKVFEQMANEDGSVSRRALIGRFASLKEARTAILEDAEKNESTSYEILVSASQSVGASDLEYTEDVTVNLKLNGHTLTAADTVNVKGTVTVDTELKVKDLNLYGSLDVSSVAVSGTLTAISGTSLCISSDSTVKLLTVSGSGSETEPIESFDIILKKASDASACPIFTVSSTVARTGDMQIPFRFHKYVDGGESDFEDGEKLAVISPAESKVPTSWFGVSDAGQCVVRNGTSLLAETMNLTVTCETTGQAVGYQSLGQAVSRLAADFGDVKGDYIFAFSGEEILSKNLTIPAMVQRLVLSGAEESGQQAELDLCGRALTTSAKVTLKDSLKLKSSASARGKLMLTGSASDMDYDFQINISGTENKILAENVDITASKGCIGFTALEGDGIYTLNSVISAKYIVVESGNWKLEKLNPVASFKNIGGAVVEADVYTQTSSGKTYLDGDSCLIIGTTAALYNLALEGQEGSAYLFRKERASVAVGGNIIRAGEGTVLSCGILDENGEPEAVVARTGLFTTNLSSFPTEAVTVYQPEGADTEKYRAVYQQGKEICAGREWFSVKTQGADGTEKEVGSFMRWTDVQDYLNTLSNTSMTYIVEMDESIDIEGNLTLPTRVGGIILRGAASQEQGTETQVVLSYTGNLTLGTETTFENIDLQGSSSASKTYSDGYFGILALNGKNLNFINSKASFSSITGKSANILTLQNSEITVTNAVAGIHTLDLTDSSLEAGGAVAITNTLRMESAVLDAAGGMSLVNVISNSEDNVLAYGGNVASNILTVAGTVTSEKIKGDKTVSVEDGETLIQKGAFDLRIHSLEAGNGYETNVTLLNGAKAAPSWFVIGSSYRTDESTGKKNRTGCAYITHKEGTVIKCGGLTDAAVMLKKASAVGGGYEIIGSFATLQEAFSEIDREVDKTAEYQVILGDDTEDTVTKTGTNLTWPLYAAHVLVRAEYEDFPKTIYYKNTLTLRCSMTFENLVLAPAGISSTIALNGWELQMKSCAVAEGKKMTSVTGSGVAKSSVLELVDTELTVYGAVSNIGSLKLDGEDTSLTAQGTVAIGSLCAATGKERLNGYAAVTRSKNLITAVTPQITVNGQIYAENGVTVGLMEKVNGSYEFLDFCREEAVNIQKTGIHLVKAVNVPGDRIQLSADNVGKTGGYYIVKSGGYLAYTTKEPDVRLNYELDGEERTTYTLTFANAVAEINSLKTKRDYTMTLLEAIEEDTLESPAALTMPGASYISSLSLQSGKTENGVTEQITLHYLNNISMTTNLELGDIAFIQVMKSGSSYMPVDKAKNDYPSIVTVATGAYTLEVKGIVSFNSPILLNGESRGTLVIDEEGQLYTKTNNILYLEDHYESLICGKVTNLASVTIGAEQCLTIQEYGTLSGSRLSYTAANFTAREVRNSGELNVIGVHAGGNAAITTLNLTGGRLEAEGNLNLTNAALTGNAQLWADKTFNITGTLTSATSNAYFYTRQKGVNQAPYLNITGTVMLQNPDTDRIHVGVYPVSTAADADSPITLAGAPAASAQLLTARSAAAESFIPWGRNVEGRTVYGPDAQDGYLLKKSGTAVYVYYGDEIKVALCKGDASEVTLQEADAAGMVLNYYISFQEAVAAVNILKDSTQEYTLLLLADVENNGAPVAITMPTYASNVIVAGERTKIYYSNTLSLKTPTVFANVELNPMNTKKAGVKLGINTGVYNLTLQNVSVGDLSGMALGNLAGNAKQTTTLDSDGLQISGNISGSGTVLVKQDAKITGTVSTSNLQLNGGVTLTTEGTLTVTNLVNDGTEENCIQYGRTAKNVTFLTVSGIIRGENPHALIFDMRAADKTEEDFALEMDAKGLKTILSEAKKLANIPKLATSDFEFRFNGGTLDGDVCQIVKANKSLYLISASMRESAVTLTDETDTSVTECLDYAQAVTEINNLAASETEYTIEINTDDLIDTNVTDSSLHSSLQLPGKNKAGALTIRPKESIDADLPSTAAVTYSGAMTAYGNLTLENLVLNPVKSAASDISADANLAVYQSNAGASLTLKQVHTNADILWEAAAQSTDALEATGFIGQILGTKNVTEVTIIDSTLRLKTGFTNINSLTLENTGIITCGAAAVNNLNLTGEAHWDALGKTTIGSIWNENAAKGTYLASRQAAKTLAPQLTITGMVSRPILWKMVRADSNNQYLQYVKDYRDTALVIAAKETADKFVAETFGVYKEDGSIEICGDVYVEAKDWISYKNGADYVRNGSVTDMAVSVTKNGGSLTYAKSFAEAVTSINNAADTGADYVIQFLQNEEYMEEGRLIVRTGTDNNFGAMTLPTKAASVTIKGSEDEEGTAIETILAYTGTLVPRCDIRFEDILLTEGSVKGGVFTPTYQITPAFGNNNYTLTFCSTAGTLHDPEGKNEDAEGASLVWNYVSAGKGELRVEDNSVYVKSYVTMPTMTLAGMTKIQVQGAVKITDLYLESSEKGEIHEENAYLQGKKTISIGNIQGTGEEKLTLDTCFTSIARAGQASVTQLTISGGIRGAGVTIMPRMYDLTDKTWNPMTEAEAEALDIQAGKTPAAGQKLAVFTKASSNQVSVMYENDGGALSVLPENYHLYKYEGALYLTTQPMGVELVGCRGENEELSEVYRAEFLDWAQAVKEIDRIADTDITYEMKLLTNSGETGGVLSPMGTLSMPTKARAVVICAEETRAVFFTGTTVTVRCNTTFDNVNLIAVKKVTSGGVVSYTPTTYHISGGNWALCQERQSAAVEAGITKYTVMVGNVSGSGRGSYSYALGTTADAETRMRLALASKISGYGRVEITGNGTEAPLSISGAVSGVTSLILNDAELQLGTADLSVANLELHGSTVSGRNLTVSGTTVLDGGIMKAGTDTVGTGICKLADITIQSGENLFQAKQDKNGTSLMNITGTVTAAPEEGEPLEPVRIGILYNNSTTRYAQLHEGMTLLTAAKAAASWFAPYYTADGNSGMGGKKAHLGLYKSGRTVKYGNEDDMEVRLCRGEETSLFATFEEAVAEINYISLYKTGTKVYEDYDIELLRDVEIGNSLGNGVYSALTLPTKAGSVRIFSTGDSESGSAGLYFSGNLTVRCNTGFEHVGLYPMKASGGKGIPTAANYAIGNCTLELTDVNTTDGSGNTLIGTVSGSSASGTLKLGDGQHISIKTLSGLKEVSLASDAELAVSGNCSAYQLRFLAEEGSRAVLHTGGTLATTLIYLTGFGDAVVQKPLPTTFTVNGASLDLNGDKVKENAAVIRENAPENGEDTRKVRIEVQTPEIPTGTKILTCKYLIPDDYQVANQAGRSYNTYQSGNSLLTGSIQAEKSIEIGGRRLKYSLSGEIFTYNGGEIKPALTLKDEADRVMEPDKDYVVSYEDNVNAGTAKLMVTLCGTDSGEGMSGETAALPAAAISFTIQRKNLSSRTVKLSFTGAFLENGNPQIRVQDSGRMDSGGDDAETVMLEEGADYTVSYGEDGKGVLKGTVYSADGGNYRGKAELTFEQLAGERLTALTSCYVTDYQKENVENAEGNIITETGAMTLWLSADSNPVDYEDSLYIVEMDYSGGNFLDFVGKAVPGAETDSEAGDGAGSTYTVTLDYGGDLLRSRMMSRYGLAVIEDTGYRIISDSLLITNPYETAVTTSSYTSFYNEKISSKKGLQDSGGWASYELGCDTVLLNINLNEMIKTSTNVRRYTAEAYSPYEYRGKTYYFFNMNKYLDTIYELNGWSGGSNTTHRQVTLNLLMKWDSELTYLIHPSGRSAGHSYYALNMTDDTARETLEALFSYMAYKLGGSLFATENYSTIGHEEVHDYSKKTRVCNWVLGNEVNSCKAWNYAGELDTTACAQNYAKSFQLLYQAVRKFDANARVFISLDHCWNASEAGHQGKAYLDAFAAYMYKTAPTMRWNVNYHPYSQPLTRNDFWNDGSNTVNNTGTGYISMKNLGVLNAYLKNLENRYFPEGSREAGQEEEYIRVILGEQGYIASDSSAEVSQAAAIAYEFMIGSMNTRVEAIINRAYMDDPAEGVMTLGLKYRNGTKKKAYSVYKELGTEKTLTGESKKYLGYIGSGAQSWSALPLCKGVEPGDVYRPL